MLREAAAEGSRVERFGSMKPGQLRDNERSWKEKSTSGRPSEKPLLNAR